jgi:GntR family transcriptional regulator, transcriptional repressor for pyruvate dehydrogenase complex
MTALRRRETLTGQLVKMLGERIADGTYKRGEKMPSEQELIEEFGVSRTVVREAIATLRANGLVSTQQGVGAFVLNRTAILPFRIEEANLGVVNEVVAVLELRIGIESEAGSLAAVRRNDVHLAAMRAAMAEMTKAIETGEDAVPADLDFHRAIAAGTENPHFLALFNYLGELLIPRTRLQTFRLNGTSPTDYLARVNREHEEIYNAIERRDPEAARAAMRLHLIGSRERLRRSVTVEHGA